MKLSGVVFRPLPSFSGAGIDAHSHHHSSVKPCFLGGSINAGALFSGELRIVGRRDSILPVKPRIFSGFSDNGHLQYYLPAIKCGGGGVKKEKEKELVSKEKKMKKRLKGLSKDISVFSGMGFGLDPEHGLIDQVKGKMILEAADVLLSQLQQLKAEKKEMKRQRKEEKAKLKAVRTQNKLECKGNSSSSSESSDSECGEMVNMSRSRLKTESHTHSRISPSSQTGTTIDLQPPNQQAISNKLADERCSSSSTGNCTSVSNASNIGCNEEAITRKIEVCMGGKCKKSGAAALLEEFQKAIGGEGSVVGCKCMGKCRNGPNVKVLNAIDGSQAVVLDDNGDDYVRTPANPLCIGVGLEDVGTIVANFLGGNQNDLGLAEAS